MYDDFDCNIRFGPVIFGEYTISGPLFGYTAYGTSAQVDGGVPVISVFLIDNRPRRARAGAARKRAAPSPC